MSRFFAPLAGLLIAATLVGAGVAQVRPGYPSGPPAHAPSYAPAPRGGPSYAPAPRAPNYGARQTPPGYGARPTPPGYGRPTAPRQTGPGYDPRGYPPRPPEAGYQRPYPNGPNSLGANWREQQDEARQGVRQGQYAPLGRVIRGIQSRTPGRQLDAGIEYMGGRPVYRVRWMTARGQRMDYMVDAATGAILSGR